VKGKVTGVEKRRSGMVVTIFAIITVVAIVFVVLLRNLLNRNEGEAMDVSRYADRGITEAYMIPDENGELEAYDVFVTVPGYKDNIETKVRIEKDGDKLLDLQIVSQNETPELGGKIMESSFLNQFNDKELPIVLSGQTEGNGAGKAIVGRNSEGTEENKTQQEAGNEKDVATLREMEAAILAGEKVAPRGYVRKYGFAARQIDDNLDYAEGFLLRPEYNLWDVLCLYAGSIQNQDALLKETVDFPISEIVTELEIPTYFVMGKYDGMTTPEAAEAYLENLVCEEKELVIFEQSAHFPQVEEKDVFLKWLWEEVWTAHGEEVLE